MDFLAWLRGHRWVAFLFHQFALFISAVLFLFTVRRLTGRTIHLGRDPVGPIDATALVVLSVAVIVLTSILYYWIKRADAKPLGVALSPRRFLEFIVGILTGLAFILWPWGVALWQGTASVYDRINAHFDRLSIIRILGVASLLLVLQAITEETTNRAFPMRLWDDRSLAFRLVVPSVFFVAIHLLNEEFSFERASVLLMAGLGQGIAYALTGNIWLSAGLHSGANLASFSVTGLWHAGALVALVGRPAVPNWLAVAIALCVMGVVYLIARIVVGAALRGRPTSSINLDV
jgi:membrane protease YdiL (CAAX protease family)